jgi:hypothetical protein
MERGRWDGRVWGYKVEAQGVNNQEDGALVRGGKKTRVVGTLSVIG